MIIFLMLFHDNFLKLSVQFAKTNCTMKTRMITLKVAKYKNKQHQHIYAFVPLSATYVQIKLLRICLLVIRDLKEYDNED